MAGSAAIHLFVIDPQNDFCDIPAERVRREPSEVAALQPALPVPGAHQDMVRLAAFIDRAGHRLDRIHVTLDSHHPLHIAHPSWWLDSDGQPPAPFTAIQASEVRQGKWRASNTAWQDHSQRYVDALEVGGRYTLIVWPEHCLIGHWGHNVHPDVAHRLDRWARDTMQTVDYIFKGSNPFTEHYSAVRAEVVEPDDPGTQLNKRLLDDLREAGSVIVAGEALSHCVANTLRDVACDLGPAAMARFTLLTDCTSSVAGFENLGTEFLHELTALRMKTARSVDLFR